MSILFQDNFESYTPLGYQIGLGGGPWDAFPATNAIVVAGSPDGVGSQSAQLGQLQFTLPFNTNSAQMSCTMNIFMPSSGNNVPGLSMLECGGRDGSGLNPVNIATFGLNPDNTIFCTAVSNQYAGSTTTPIRFNTWYTVTLNLIVSFYTISFINYVSVQVNIAIDGIEEVNQLLLTSVVQTPSYTGVSEWIFTGPTNHGGIMDNIVVTNIGGSISPPVATQPAKLFQALVETEIGGSAQAQIYQGAVEILIGKPPAVRASCVMNG